MPTSSERCVAPTLDYGIVTTVGGAIIGPRGETYIYTMSPFTSSCSGRVVGYWFCYQNTSSTTGDRVNISTVLLLRERGQNRYHIVEELNVMAEPSRDECQSAAERPIDGQCCIIQGAAKQFEVNSSYLYGVIPRQSDGPDMMQTQSSNSDTYRFASPMNMNRMLMIGSSSPWQVKLFQFIIGELLFKETFAQSSLTELCLHFQTIVLLM